MRYYLLILGFFVCPLSQANDLISGFSWSELPKPKMKQEVTQQTTQEVKQVEQNHNPQHAKSDQQDPSNDATTASNKPLTVSRAKDSDCVKTSHC